MTSTDSAVTVQPSDRTLLPGYGLPLSQESHLPRAVDSWNANPITVRERMMISVIVTLKDKPEWHQKVFDEQIVAKWRTEAMQIGSEDSQEHRSEDEDRDQQQNGQSIAYFGAKRQETVSERMFEFCIAELRHDAVKFGDLGYSTAIDANAAVYFSDTAIDDNAKAALRNAAAPLEHVRDDEKDWHPGSDDKVLDLVHPSLFPLVYGRSRILPNGTVPLKDCVDFCAKGEVVPEPENLDSYYSSCFQWLPCEVQLRDDGSAKITSYINNLHPDGHEGLYAAIEEVIAKSVPLWTQALLSTLALPVGNRFGDVGDGFEHSSDYDPDLGEDEDYDELEHIRVPEPRDYMPRTRKSRDFTSAWHGKDHQPEANVKDGEIEEEAAKIRAAFADKGMQVIVKVANIHLTPDKPSYDGGSWHIEGQLNEHICASALYYYDSDNITDSYLAFREGVNKEVLEAEYEQNREHGICEIYGILDTWGDAMQMLGKVLTREGRLLVFPNVLQHRVSPFKLADPTKPGHRKLLALFLVDPFICIPSTANVPPQQRDWWADNLVKHGLLAKLPVEMADRVVDAVEDIPISLEEAKIIREELIEERRQYVEEVNEIWREQGYCFCEH